MRRVLQLLRLLLLLLSRETQSTAVLRLDIAERTQPAHQLGKVAGIVGDLSVPAASDVLLLGRQRLIVGRLMERNGQRLMAGLLVMSGWRKGRRRRGWTSGAAETRGCRRGEQELAEGARVSGLLLGLAVMPMVLVVLVPRSSGRAVPGGLGPGAVGQEEQQRQPLQ